MAESAGSVLLRRTRLAPVPPRPRRRIRRLRLLALACVLGVLAATAFSYGLVLAVGQQLSGLDPSRQHRLQVDGYVYARDGHTILAVLRGSQSRVLVSSAQISPWLKQAIVAAEDRRFWEHRGIDVRGMARALWADVRGRPLQGGSTITQQFVKNSLTGDERTVTRKLKEAALAWQLEQRWTKDRILTAYLNTIYFGNGAYGAERAARTYFGHSAKKLTLPEAALLAGIPEDPSLYDPVRHPAAADARRALVLRLMLSQGVISAAQFRWARRQPLPKPDDVHLSGVRGAAPYFGEYVKSQLIARLGARSVFGGGLRVRTTIDLRLQKLATAAVTKWLPDPNGPQAALVAMDARTGAVLAMVGGRNFHRSQFNLAVQGVRQPGSSFKPFVLAAALREGISPASTFRSGPVSIFLGNRYWPVHNFEGESLGTIDLTKAIAVSDNTVFAQLTKDVGPQNVVRTAHALGIMRPLHGVFSIGLGTQAVSPLDMARAYASFADGGYRIDGSLLGDQPRTISRITDASGKPVEVEPAAPAPDPLLDRERPADAAPRRRRLRAGPGTAAAIPGRAVAGKTGTTENYGDAWFVGYTPQLVTAVWVGYPEGLKPMLHEFHGGPVVGGSFPALIWKTFTQSALDAIQAPPSRSRRRPISPARRGRSPTATGASSWTTGSAPARRCSSTSAAAGRGRRRIASRTRSTSQTSSASRWSGPRRAWRRSR